jgi:hypothetical protein
VGDSVPISLSDIAPTGFERAIAVASRLATSWTGQLTAYIGAVTAVVIAFQRLPEPLNSSPVWLRIAVLAALPAFALVSHTIPTLLDQRRRKRLAEITGRLQPGYFCLAPRDQELPFSRADGKHEEILRWLDQQPGPVSYLTGLSGTGKTSLLASWVLPKLEQKGALTVRLRGYQDPMAVLEQQLRKPGVIWQKPFSEGADVRSLLERVCRFIRPKRLLVVLDQFEEFAILEDDNKKKDFAQLLSSFQADPVSGVSFLLVFRSDYIGLIEALGLPALDQRNWREIPPFFESAALDFLRGSGLQVSDDLLRGVLREAAEIEQSKGLIRPITINLCGLVLGRFASGLPRGFRPGGLIRGFLRETLFLPSIRDIAPLLIPQLVTNNVTKRPRTIHPVGSKRGCRRGASSRMLARSGTDGPCCCPTT